MFLSETSDALTPEPHDLPDPWWIRYVFGPLVVLYFLTVGAGIRWLGVTALWWLLNLSGVK